MTLSINDTQHKNAQHKNTVLSAGMLSVVILSAVCGYSECHIVYSLYAECCYAECHYSKCHGTLTFRPKHSLPLSSETVIFLMSRFVMMEVLFLIRLANVIKN